MRVTARGGRISLILLYERSFAGNLNWIFAEKPPREPVNDPLFRGTYFSAPKMCRDRQRLISLESRDSANTLSSTY
jgi:hypothetical protein